MPPVASATSSFPARLRDTSAPKYEIRPLERKEFPQWEELVRQSPQGTIFHTPLWLEASGGPFQLFGCFRGAELRAGCAIGLLGKRCAGAPHTALTPYLGILFPPAGAKYVTTISTNKQIAGAFARFLKREFDSIQFRCPPEVVDLQPFIWEGFHAGVRYTYRLSLRNLDSVLENMAATRRRNVRSAEREGLCVRDPTPFSDVLALSEKSFERQGQRVRFRAAAERFNAALEQAGRCRAFLVRNSQGAALGAVWIVWDEKRAYYLIGGYDQATWSSNAVALAMWRAIQFSALELRLPEFDFEGSMIQAVERFFRKFGGTLIPTYMLAYQRPTSFGRRIARRIAHLSGVR